METKNIYNLIILDESGSMGCIERQAVSAMNETIQGVRNAQKANPGHNYYISLVVFEGNGIEGVRTVRDRVPVESIEDIKQEESEFSRKKRHTFIQLSRRCCNRDSGSGSGA